MKLDPEAIEFADQLQAALDSALETAITDLYNAKIYDRSALTAEVKKAMRALMYRDFVDYGTCIVALGKIHSAGYLGCLTAPAIAREAIRSIANGNHFQASWSPPAND